MLDDGGWLTPSPRKKNVYPLYRRMDGPHTIYHIIYFHPGDPYRITKSTWIWKVILA